MRAARPVLVTRPSPGLEATCARLRAAGLAPWAAPMLRIAPGRIDPPPVPAPQACLATSAGALAALAGAGLAATALFAVGEATASRAREAGFAAVHAAGGEQEALAALCIARLDPGGGPLLLASGAGHGLALAARLRAAGFRVRRRVAYRQVAASAWPEEADRFLDSVSAARPGAALFLSGSAARGFARLLPAGREAALARVDALGISAAALRPVARLPWRRLHVAVSPTAEDVLGLL